MHDGASSVTITATVYGSFCTIGMCWIPKGTGYIFRRIKQNPKIKAYIGNSKNAVMTQIWEHLCDSLLLAYLKFSARLGWSMHYILRLLQLNLFMRRDLMALLPGDPTDHQPPDTLQLCLA